MKDDKVALGDHNKGLAPNNSKVKMVGELLEYRRYWTFLLLEYYQISSGTVPVGIDKYG